MNRKKLPLKIVLGTKENGNLTEIEVREMQASSLLIGIRYNYVFAQIRLCYNAQKKRSDSAYTHYKLSKIYFEKLENESSIEITTLTDFSLMLERSGQWITDGVMFALGL